MAMRSIIIALFLALAAFAQEPPDYYCLPNDSAVKYVCGTQQDSVEAYYKKRAERSLQLGLRHKSISTNFFIGGGIGLAASNALLIYAVSDYRNRKLRNDSTANEPVPDADPLPFFSFIGIGVSVGCIVAGTIFMITGNKKLRKAEYFKNQLEIYHQQKSSVSLEILPTFNPIRQTFGGNLLLEF